MKITIEVSDALLHAANALAKQNRIPLRAMVEDGLRRVISDPQLKTTPIPAFKLRDASVRGQHILLAEPRQWQQM